MNIEIQLRDYFAVNCPPENITRPTWGDIKKFKKLKEDARIEDWKDEYSSEWECVQRYRYADAMMEARKTIV